MQVDLRLNVGRQGPQDVGLEGLDGALGPVWRGGVPGPVDARADQQQHRRQDEQPARPPPAKQVDHAAAQGVRHQDVARPDQQGVDQADDQQPGHAAVVDAGGRQVGPVAPLVHQYDARPEEHRKQGHELGAGEHLAEPPDRQIDPADGPGGVGVEVGGFDHRERADVDDQDAEQGEAAQHVDGDDALGRGGGAQGGGLLGGGSIGLRGGAAGRRGGGRFVRLRAGCFVRLVHRGFLPAVRKVWPSVRFCFLSCRPQHGGSKPDRQGRVWGGDRHPCPGSCLWIMYVR